MKRVKPTCIYRSVYIFVPSLLHACLSMRLCTAYFVTNLRCDILTYVRKVTEKQVNISTIVVLNWTEGFRTWFYRHILSHFLLKYKARSVGNRKSCIKNRVCDRCHCM
jgi:hypothetical protein